MTIVHKGLVRSGKFVSYCQPSFEFGNGDQTPEVALARDDASSEWKDVTCPDCLAQATENTLLAETIRAAAEADIKALLSKQ